MRAAGIVLVVLGSLWAAVGAVLVFVSMSWSNPAALPDWVDPGTSDSAALGRLALVGVIGMLVGGAQLASGLGAQRATSGWAQWVGLAAALFGVLVAGAWLLGGLAEGVPVLIFLPVAAAYAYAAWAFAFRRAD